MAATDVLFTVVGALAVLTALADVFFTVLFPASGRGPVRKPLGRLISRGFRLVGRRTTGARRTAILAYGGPVQILLSMMMWMLVLTVGWALMYLPALGTEIRAASGETHTGFAAALYYSGFTLTTLGTGDVVAESAGYRLLTVVESGTGFAVITMVITYFLSVYSALPGRNAFAMKLHHRSLCTDDAAVLVAGLVQDSVAVAREHLGSSAEFLRHTTQTHRAYPVLRHFHYQDDYYALPRLVLTVLDTAALIGSTLDRRQYDELIRASVLDELSLAAESLLQELLSAAPTETADPAPERVEQWRRRQAEAAAVMRDRGVTVRTDPAAAEDYVRLRARWDARLAVLADEMLYEWDDRLQWPPVLDATRSGR